ncbi:hypothetical protein [Nocardia asiatica]|uniref:hypothetical protein n=1 Tax=Nocardia asiatica TaxID=209252 RepID=UPI0024556A66|nr:hypothetical protein [Nocardia asiatica]
MGSDAIPQGGVNRGALPRGGGRENTPTLAELRRRMETVPGRGESSAQRVPLDSGSRNAALPVPAALAPLLPDGGLVKGSVVAYTGASSLLAGLLAAVTESGGGGPGGPGAAGFRGPRARNKGATLVVADGRWPGASLQLDARVAGYTGLGRGRGRLRSLGLTVEVRGKAGPPRRGRLDLCPNAGRVEWVLREKAARAVEAVDTQEAVS